MDGSMGKADIKKIVSLFYRTPQWPSGMGGPPSATNSFMEGQQQFMS
jgi:hypothetical protein